MKEKRYMVQALPNYTRGEELLNMISHIVGGGLGQAALLACVITAAFNQNVWGVVSGVIYGFSVILLFTMSSIYHGLRIELPKKIFRIIDHCTIYILIAGTYTPVLLNQFRAAYPRDAWFLFGLVWALAILGIVLNSLDLKRFQAVSVISYIGMGWVIVFRIRELIEVLGSPFFVLLLLGGILYTVGALFYVIGRHKRYMHCVFHIFVNIASILHSVAIAVFIMPMG